MDKDLDPFDLICHIAYDQPSLSRRQRAARARTPEYFAQYGDTARTVLETLLDKYADEGVIELGDVKLLGVQPLAQLGTPVELLQVFGGKNGYLGRAAAPGPAVCGVGWFQESTAEYQRGWAGTGACPDDGSRPHSSIVSALDKTDISKKGHGMELEFNIRLRSTTLHIGHADLTAVDADVLVCPGNTYLSMSQGVALAISKKAGDAIGLDLRKHPLPAKLGAVIVTGAGQLSARYIFHVITGGYLLQTSQDTLTAHIIKAGDQRATAANRTTHPQNRTTSSGSSLETPLLAAGRKAGLPPAQSVARPV